MSETAHGPLHQFEISKILPIEIGGYDVSFTNSSLFMLVSITAVTIFLVMGMGRGSLVPGRWQSMAELFYEFVANMLKENVGSAGRAYFPFIFTLFMFIFACNLIGMVPGSFTVTSHIIVTFAFALVIFIGVTIIGFVKHGLGYLHLFLPSGTPIVMAPLMIVIEVFSYFSRPVSLSIRLAANMIAGHILLKVIAGFVVSMGFFGIFPVAFMVILVGFEIFVAILQAYIFTVLTCVYLNDAVHLH